MPTRALIQKRPWLVASIAVAVAYFLLRDAPVPGPVPVLLKGSACALLALYALLQLGREGRLPAAMMGVAALADMGIAFDFGAGALLFFFYHLLAMSLYLQHPREHRTPTQQAAAMAMLLLTPIVAWLLPADRTMAWSVGLYGLALGGMAACAWMSAFPRYRVGVGAALFLASDLLLIAGMGPLESQALPDALVWPLYYAGQFLITVGLVQTLQRRRQVGRGA
jgi:uncharacterized membrane protein YhhN